MIQREKEGQKGMYLFEKGLFLNGKLSVVYNIRYKEEFSTSVVLVNDI